jgi:hypothetical protein
MEFLDAAEKHIFRDKCRAHSMREIQRNGQGAIATTGVNVEHPVVVPTASIPNRHSISTPSTSEPNGDSETLAIGQSTQVPN